MAERTHDREEVVLRRQSLDESLESTNSRLGGQPASDNIRRDIANTRASLDQKLDLLENKVRGVQTNVKQAFDFNHQFNQHPWAMLGASVATGFTLGLLTSGGEHHEERRYRESWRERAGDWAGRAGRLFETGDGPGSGGYGAHSGSGHREVQRHDIFDTLKLAAGAAITDLARQAISKYIPALGEQLDKVWREQGLTPMTAASALFSRRPQPESDEEKHARQPGSSGQHGGPTGSAGAGSNLAQDYNPTVAPSGTPMRGEMASRS